MANHLARSVIDAAKGGVKSALFTAGFHRHRMPRVLWEQPDARLEIALPMLCAYHALTHPHCRYVHIGAFDGLTGDPLGASVRRLGWEGVLVEPQPHRFEQLRRNLGDVPGLRFENAAIAATNGTAAMYGIRHDLTERGYPHGSSRDFLDQCASLDRATIERSVRMFLPGVDPDVAIDSFDVPTLTLGMLLKKYDWNTVDLLQIDAEGLDYEIVKMVDLHTHRPAIVHYEYMHLARADHDACARLLVEHGYRLFVYHMNVLAYHEDHLT